MGQAFLIDLDHGEDGFQDSITLRKLLDIFCRNGDGKLFAVCHIGRRKRERVVLRIVVVHVPVLSKRPDGKRRIATLAADEVPAIEIGVVRDPLFRIRISRIDFGSIRVADIIKRPSTHAMLPMLYSAKFPLRYVMMAWSKRPWVYFAFSWLLWS